MKRRFGGKAIKRVSRKSGDRFEAYVRVDGRQEFVGTFETRRLASKAADDWRAREELVDAGTISPETTDTTRTLGKACEEWFDSLEQRRSRSYDGYRYRIERYVLPMLGADTLLPQVRKANVMSWRDHWSRKLAANTVNGALIALSAAFSHFVDCGWISTNPCRGVRQVKLPRERLYVWIESREEITKLLLECPRGIRELVTVALATGMRLDELLHLQWADVDLQRRLITVHRGRFGTTKSGKARRIPILDTLLPVLSELALQRGGATLVFPGRNGKPRTKPGVREPFKQAAARAGLPKELRFHDLRHTFASHWVQDRGDLFRLSTVLGHSSVAITQKIYAHLAPEAWEQDYHRVAFVVPDKGTVYALTKRRPTNSAATAIAAPAAVAANDERRTA